MVNRDARRYGQGNARPDGRIVPLYHSSDVLPRIVSDSDSDVRVLSTNDWGHFTSFGHQAVCEVLVVPDLSDWSLWPDFMEHQAQHQLTPRILVTGPSLEGLRRTMGAVFEELIWLEPGHRIELLEAVERASSRGLLQRCSQIFKESHRDLTPELSAALTRACDVGRAVRTVNELAHLAGRDRRTITASWVKFWGPNSPFGLKHLLDLLVLLHAVHQRHHGRRWPRIAHDLGMTSDALRRLASARLGKPLGDLGMEDGRAIVRQLEMLFRTNR